MDHIYLSPHKCGWVSIFGPSFRLSFVMALPISTKPPSPSINDFHVKIHTPPNPKKNQPPPLNFFTQPRCTHLLTAFPVLPSSFHFTPISFPFSFLPSPTDFPIHTLRSSFPLQTRAVAGKSPRVSV